MKKLISVLLCLVTILSLSACGGRVPKSTKVITYTPEKLEELCEEVTKDTLIDAWGEPQVVNDVLIWEVKTESLPKYITVGTLGTDWDTVACIQVSVGMFVTVTEIKNDFVFGKVSFEGFETNENNLVLLPRDDIFGNSISYSVGEQYYFETDGVIMETYPAQIARPYFVKLMSISE